MRSWWSPTPYRSNTACNHIVQHHERNEAALASTSPICTDSRIVLRVLCIQASTHVHMNKEAVHIRKEVWKSSRQALHRSWEAVLRAHFRSAGVLEDYMRCMEANEVYRDMPMRIPVGTLPSCCAAAADARRPGRAGSASRACMHAPVTRGDML